MDSTEFQAIHDEIWRTIYERQQPSFNLKTAVGNAPSVQDFESECLAREGEHSQMGKAPPPARHSGSKDCADGAFPTAVFRFKRNTTSTLYTATSENSTFSSSPTSRKTQDSAPEAR